MRSVSTYSTACISGFGWRNRQGATWFSWLGSEWQFITLRPDHLKSQPNTHLMWPFFTAQLVWGQVPWTCHLLNSRIGFSVMFLANVYWGHALLIFSTVSQVPSLLLFPPLRKSLTLLSLPKQTCAPHIIHILSLVPSECLNWAFPCRLWSLHTTRSLCSHHPNAILKWEKPSLDEVGDGKWSLKDTLSLLTQKLIFQLSLIRGKYAFQRNDLEMI